MLLSARAPASWRGTFDDAWEPGRILTPGSGERTDETLDGRIEIASKLYRTQVCPDEPDDGTGRVPCRALFIPRREAERSGLKGQDLPRR